MSKPLRDAKLRIAQVAPLWARLPPKGYGGIELAVTLLSEELVRRGHEVTVFASGDSITSGQLRSVCDQSLLDLMAEGRAANYEYYVAAQMAEVVAVSGEFDLIHSHLDANWLPFGTVMRSPSLFTLHTHLSEDDRWTLARHPTVPANAISHDQIRELQLAGKRPIPVIYNSCDFDAYEVSEGPGEYLAFLGRMSRNKNPVTAIRLAKEIGIPIVLAGQPQDSGEEAYFNEQVVPLIDGKFVRHLGTIDHAGKREFFRKAAALIFPIQWAEPFGLVMIEAMASGVPVLGRRLGSVPEVVDDGITGFAADFEAELSVLLPKVLALDRRAVRAHARGRFHYSRMVDDYEALYRRIVSGGDR